MFDMLDIYLSQLVAAVTELVVAELMYLQWMDPKAPIYIYINSTGTTRDDGESVSSFLVVRYLSGSVPDYPQFRVLKEKCSFKC